MNSSIFGMISFLVFLVIQLSSARTLFKLTPRHNQHRNYHKITFLMQNVLNATHLSVPKPAATTKTNNHIPFPKPLGFFPPNGGIPLPEYDPTTPATGSLDVSSIGLSFPARATLQELEFGSLTEIEEDLFEGSSTRSVHKALAVGKAKGVFVASSEDGTSHMVAMVANFARRKFKDGLRFFGVYKTDAPESHIAVIGGTGKYQGANGYAVIKVVDGHSNGSGEGSRPHNKHLLFNVYLS